MPRKKTQQIGDPIKIEQVTRYVYKGMEFETEEAARFAAVLSDISLAIADVAELVKLYCGGWESYANGIPRQVFLDTLERELGKHHKATLEVFGKIHSDLTRLAESGAFVTGDPPKRTRTRKPRTPSKKSSPEAETKAPPSPDTPPAAPPPSTPPPPNQTETSPTSSMFGGSDTPPPPPQ